MISVPISLPKKFFNPNQKFFYVQHEPWSSQYRDATSMKKVTSCSQTILMSLPAMLVLNDFSPMAGAMMK
jgi:hypothetical protein